MALSVRINRDADTDGDVVVGINNETKEGPGFSLISTTHDESRGLSFGELSLGVFGACAIILYYKPGQDCAVDDFCMGVLGRNLPSVAPYFFSYVGGVDVAGMNFIMAIEAYPELRAAFYDKPVSAATQLAIIGIGSASLIEKLLLALGTNASPMLTGAIIAATLPGTIYGAVKLGKTEIPYLGSLIHEYFNMEKEKYDHYKAQRGLFFTRGHQKMIALRRAASSGELKEIGESENPLAHLWRYDINENPEYLRSEQEIREALNIMGTILGLSLSAGTLPPIILNGLNKFASIPWLFIRVPVVDFVCASAIYGLTKYCMSGVELAVNFLRSIAKGEPIPSMLYQLRPTATTLALLANLAVVTPFSYAVICMVWLHNISVDDPTREPIGWTSFAGIYVIHATSLVHLFNKLFSKMTPDQRLRFYLKLENSLEELEHRLTVDGFRELAQKIAYEDFDIQLLDEDKPLRLVETPKSAPSPKAPVNREEKAQPLGYWSRFTTYISGRESKPAALELQAQRASNSR